MKRSNDSNALTTRIRRLTGVVNKLKNVRSVQSGLLELSELASKVQDLSEFYPALQQVVASNFPAQNFFILLQDPQSKELEPVYFVDEKDGNCFPTLDGILDGLAGYVYRTGKRLICDKSTYQQLVESKQITQLGSASELWFGVPLIRSGKTIGVMAVQFYQSGVVLTEQAIALFEHLGLHLLTAVNRIKRRELLESDVKQRTEQLSLSNKVLKKEIIQRKEAEQLKAALFEISEISSAPLNDDQFYKSLHGTLSELMRAENFYIALVDQDQLTFPYFCDKYQTRCEERKLGQGFTEYVLKSQSPQLIDHDRAQQLKADGKVIFDHKVHCHPATDWLGAPLLVNDKVIGVLAVQAYDHEYQYNKHDLQLLTFVSHHIANAIGRKKAADALRESHNQLEMTVAERTQELRQSNLFLRLQVEERKKAEQKLFHQANHDSLTGLANRNLFQVKLARVLAHAKRHPEHNFALLFIDIDRFKAINDSCGHQVGDEFLVEVASRINRCVRDNDIVARIGGDEFVILLDMLSATELAKTIAARIINDLSQEFLINQQHISSGASIGIAVFDHEYDDADSIMRDADMAMYKAKSSGRNQYVMFDDSMADDSVSTEHILNNALANDQLFVELQGIYSNSVQKFSCMLAKPMWQHPQLGDVPLADFYNQLHQANMSLEADYHLLTILGQHDANQTVFLPVCVSHLQHLKQTQTLIQKITSSELLKQQLVLVFSENDLVSLAEHHLKNVRLLKKAGIKVAIGDFAERHGALSLLANMPVDYLFFANKVVKSVAANPMMANLFSASLVFCKSMQTRPIVSGVDLHQHETTVVSHAVDLYIGNYRAQHVTAENSTTLLFKQRA